MKPGSAGDNFVTDEKIMNCIYVIRGQKVMIAVDLAELYAMDIHVFTREVILNVCHFPDGLVFELNDEDFDFLHLQNKTMKRRLRIAGSCLAFTEQAIPMLSCLLRTEMVIAINSRLIRIFYLIRQISERCSGLKI